MQLAQHACQLYVLVGLEQRGGVLQLQAHIGARGACQNLAHHAQGAPRVAGIGIGQRHGAQQLGVLPHKRFGLRQRCQRLRLLALRSQCRGRFCLHMHPHAFLQAGNVARAVGLRNAFQRGQRIAPVLCLGRQQGAGIQGFRHQGVGHQQAFHHAARFAGGAHLQVKACQVQAHPGIGRVVEQGVFQGQAGAVDVPPLGSGLGLPHGLGGAQPAQGPHLFLLAGRQLFHQLQRFGCLVVLRQHTDQTADRVRVVLLACQDAAVGGLGLVVVAGFHQQISQSVLRRHFARVQANRLLQERARSGTVVGFAGLLRLVHQGPVTGAFKSLFPARGGTATAGPLQVVARLGKFFLAQPQDAHAAQRVVVVGARLQHAVKSRFGRFQVAVVQRLEALIGHHAQRVGGGCAHCARLALLGFNLSQPGLHRSVARVGTQKSLVERRV